MQAKTALGQSRAVDRRQAFSKTFATAEALSARHAAAIAQIRAALVGRSDAGVAILVERLAAQTTLKPRLVELLARFDRMMLVYRFQHAAFERALAIPQPQLRELALSQIQVSKIAAAGLSLVEAIDDLADDELMSRLLGAQRINGNETRASLAPGVSAPTLPRTSEPTLPRVGEPTLPRVSPPSLPGARPTTVPGSSPRPAIAAATPAMSAPRRAVPAPEGRPAPVRLDPAEEAHRAAATDAVEHLQHAVAEIRPVYAYTAERVSLLEGGVAIYRRPTEDPAAVLPDSKPKVVNISAAVARLYASTPPIYRRSQIAIVQTTELRRELLKVDLEVERILKFRPIMALAAARAINLPSLRGKVIPLMNFPRVFEADPLLMAIFPKM